MTKEKKMLIKLMIVIIFLAIIIIPSTLSIFKSSSQGYGELALAEWNVTLIDSGASTALTVVPEISNATYSVTVRSLSEVDAKYSIVINNLPTGVQVSLDNGAFQTQSSNTITFSNVGTILYSDSQKTRTHTLTFSAVSGATPVNNQPVNISVVVEQIL